jgi:predicted metal-dependent phosphoesterase TrpH
MTYEMPAFAGMTAKFINLCILQNSRIVLVYGVKVRKKTSTRFVQILSNVLITIFVTIVLLTDSVCQQSEFHIENPYANVDWVKHGQYKANLHTHTSMGEANAAPQVVIDRYRGLGYKILALTDHDDNVTGETTWPWQKFQRDPDTLGMIAIQGNEISEVHHIGSFFNDYGNPDAQFEEETIEEIGRRGGLAVFNHPGRHEKTVEWYVDMFRRYKHLVGLEIYIKKDKYPGDRKTWDAIPTELMLERSVWGFFKISMLRSKRLNSLF